MNNYQNDDTSFEELLLLAKEIAKQKAYSPKKAFESSPYQCPECLDIIQSKFPGEFVACKCGMSFVDETRHYVRVGGPAKPYNKDE